MPTTETTTAASSDAPIPRLRSEIDANEVPLSPPAPDTTTTRSSTTTPASSPVAPPPPPPAAPVKKRKGFFRRLYNRLVTLILLGAISFGGGVWYSRINDNFHDFFTEYVPYGEQAVLYFEELDLQKRYPRLNLGGVRSKSTGESVRIQPQSGASWRVADSGEPAGRQSSAMRDIAASKKAAASPSPEKQPTVTEAKPSPEASRTEPVPVAKSAEPPKAGTAALEQVTENATAKVRNACDRLRSLHH